MKDAITILAVGIGMYCAILPTAAVVGCIACYLAIHDKCKGPKR